MLYRLGLVYAPLQSLQECVLDEIYLGKLPFP